MRGNPASWFMLLPSLPLLAAAFVSSCNSGDDGLIAVTNDEATNGPGPGPADPGPVMPGPSLRDRMACDDSRDCPGAEVCFPPAGRCADCATDAECPDGTVCSVGLCKAPCDSDLDCKPYNQVCDLDGARCVDCLTDSACPEGSGAVCYEGICRINPPVDDDDADDDVADDDTVSDDVVDDDADDDTMTDDVPVDDDAADDDVTDDDTADDTAADDADDDTADVMPDAGADDDVADDDTADDTADDDTADDVGDCTMETTDPCSAGLPRFEGTQNVDGMPDDFCDVPALELTFDSAALTIGDPEAGAPHRAEIRVAWSEEALHLHATVTDPAVHTQAPPESWSGDSLDVYVSPSSDQTGSLEGPSGNGAVQLILAPPGSDGTAASATMFPDQVSAPGSFAAVATSDGYMLEMTYPWSSPVSSGAAISLNFALNIRESAGCDSGDFNACRNYYAAHVLESAGSPSGCDGFSLLSGGSAEPWCDDRTWCAPTLSP